MNTTNIINVVGGFIIGYYVTKHYFVTGGKAA